MCVLAVIVFGLVHENGLRLLVQQSLEVAFS